MYTLDFQGEFDRSVRPEAKMVDGGLNYLMGI